MQKGKGDMLKRPGNKKGFTLIELIVTIAVFSIFSLGVVGVVVPVLNLYSGAIKLSDARLMAENIAAVIENEFEYARPSLLYGEAPGNGEDKKAGAGAVSADGKVIEFKSVYGTTKITSGPEGRDAGYLYMARGPKNAGYSEYFNKEYYKDGSVDISFSNEGGDLFAMSVTVNDKNGHKVFTLDRKMKPLAFK